MKSEIVKFRVSESEKERIEGMADRARTTLSEYCRQVCLNGRILAASALTPGEVSYFRALKDHNNGFARLTNLIRNRDPQLCAAVAEYLEQSRELYSRFF